MITFALQTAARESHALMAHRLLETNLALYTVSIIARLPNRKAESQWTQEGQNVVEKVSISLLSLVATLVLAASVLTRCGTHRLQK